MPWRLIGVLLILTFFVIFSGFNTHKITIYFGPVSFPDIPLFVALVTTFIFGAFSVLPFSIIKSVKKARRLKREKKQEVSTPKKITGPSEQPVVTTEKEIKKSKNKTKKK